MTMKTFGLLKTAKAGGRFGVRPRSFSSSNTVENKNTDTQKLVESQYYTGHRPLVAKKDYGPPYTDTSLLENWPKEVFSSHQEPKRMSDKFAIGLVSFFKVGTHLFFRNK